MTIRGKRWIRKAKGRPPGGRRKGMNGTEAAYALCLEADPNVVEYKFEAITLRLAERTTYTPDFMVQLTDGTIEMHEVKGFPREDAMVKLKVAADLFPFTFRIIRKEGKGWEIKEITDGMKENIQ